MLKKMFTVYSTGFVALAAAANSTGSQTITIEAGTDFEIHFITGIASQANAIVVTFDGTVQVSWNQPSTQTFFNTPVRFMEVAGDGRQPYPLREPQLVRANSTLTVNFVNSAAGVATNICLSLHGYKVPTS